MSKNPSVSVTSEELSPERLAELEREAAGWDRGDFADGSWELVTPPHAGASHPECNHHHPVTGDHEWVDFGHGPFVANKRAIPLLRALHELGLRTRTHHIAGEPYAFISILIDEHVTAEVRVVNERDATRTQYNGMTEVLLSWSCPVPNASKEPPGFDSQGSD